MKLIAYQAGDNNLIVKLSFNLTCGHVRPNSFDLKLKRNGIGDDELVTKDVNTWSRPSISSVSETQSYLGHSEVV